MILNTLYGIIALNVEYICFHNLWFDESPGQSNKISGY
jgi:hypothetical protein